MISPKDASMSLLRWLKRKLRRRHPRFLPRDFYDNWFDYATYHTPRELRDEPPGIK